MRFPLFLKKLSTEFIEVYETAFSKTIIATLLWTVLCFAIAQILAAYSNYDANIHVQPVSILSFFILRFSLNETYSYVDLVKTIYIFLVAIFSVNVIRKIRVKDVLYLTGMLVVCALLDCALFRLSAQLQRGLSNNSHAIIWFDGVIYLLRLYLPMLLFAITIQLCTSKINVSFKKIAFLLVALWIFNELSYEFTMLVRSSIFNLLMILLKPQTYRYVTESILGLPLMAFYFLGYYCAMTAPFKLLDAANA